jgi:SAM-dependent methyltransferase
VGQEPESAFQMQVASEVQVSEAEASRDGASAWISTQDLERSATVHMLADLERALAPLRGLGLSRLLDIGCGFGGLACFSSAFLGIGEKHGVDWDGSALCEARQKGLETARIEVGREALPYPDGHFDLNLERFGHTCAPARCSSQTMSNQTTRFETLPPKSSPPSPR